MLFAFNSQVCSQVCHKLLKTQLSTEFAFVEVNMIQTTRRWAEVFRRWMEIHGHAFVQCLLKWDMCEEDYVHHSIAPN
jgi:hypothetical protein